MARAFDHHLLRITLLVTAALAVGGMLLLPDSAHAVDSCKARIDKKTGIVTMSATNLVGLFGWRDSASDELQGFFGNDCVIVGDDLVSCPLADPSTGLAKVPPPSCEVCIADSSGSECCTRLRGCTPGTRDCTTVETQLDLNPNTKKTIVASCPAGYRATGGGGLHIQFLGTLPLLGNVISNDGKGWACTGYNDANINSLLTCSANCCRMP